MNVPVLKLRSKPWSRILISSQWFCLVVKPTQFWYGLRSLLGGETTGANCGNFPSRADDIFFIDTADDMRGIPMRCASFPKRDIDRLYASPL
jgi:hypothetical protein